MILSHGHIICKEALLHILICSMEHEEQSLWYMYRDIQTKYSWNAKAYALSDYHVLV